MTTGSFFRSLFAGIVALGALALVERAAAQSMPCNDVQEICQAIMGPPCLQTLGAGSVAAGDDTTVSACQQAATAFRLCLEKVAGACNTDSAASGVDAAPGMAIGGTVRKPPSDFEPQRTRQGDVAVPIELVFGGPVAQARDDKLPILNKVEAEATFRGVPVD